MKTKRITRILIAISIAAILLVPSALLHNPAVSPASATQPVKLTQLQQKLISGFASFEFLTLSTSERSVQKDPSAYFPSGDDGCSTKVQNNIKVNQNCLNLTDATLQGRAQAQNEPSIAQDPNHPDHVLVAYNDYRRGDGTCGTSYSLNGGKDWADSTVPNGFTSGVPFGGVAREYWEASGDTSVAFDSRGNAYLGCQMFQRGDFGVTNNIDFSSGIFVFRSTQNDGASWNFQAHAVAVSPDVIGATLLDKPYMTVDSNPGSPFRDRVYVTYTFFDSDGTVKIYESHSNNYGQTFTPRVLVSQPSALCPISISSAAGGICDANQDSQPFAGPDGSLYVVYNNYNNAVTGADNRNQILLSKSTDGGVTFSAPVKVSDFYDLPDCATYQAGQDIFRACVPEKGAATNSVFRANNYPSGAVDPTNPSHIVVAFGSYINSLSKESNGCIPASFSGTTGQNLFTGVKTAGACNNKILVSSSTNGGTSFTGTTTDPRSLPTANTAEGQEATDQWWQWSAFQKDGTFVVSYYDRQYGSDETTGSMDFSISSSNDHHSFDVERVTSSSMPLPTQFPDSLGNSVFMGDYTGLASVGNKAHPVWVDTRDSDLFLCPGTAVPGVPPALCNGIEPNGLTANDQDIFTRALGA